MGGGRPGGGWLSCPAVTIRAVLWDFGGVVTTSPFEAFNAFERERGLPEGIIRQINATNPHENAWALLERSDVDVAGFGPLFAAEAAALGHDINGADVLALLSGRVRPQMAEAVRRCSERLVCVCLTNNFRSGDGVGLWDDERAREVKAVRAHFHQIIESSKVGLRKPDPRIYRLACEKMGVAPEEVVFLDDLGINLKPARELGMTTIKVVDPDRALDELEAAVGFPLR